MAARLAVARHGLLLVVILQLAVVHAQRGEGDTLRGSVACLDCAPDHDLSGVVVAVKCRDGAGLRAAQTDGRGNFNVVVPAGGQQPSPCAARVLGGADQLCAPERLTVSPVVAGREPGSYALGSRLAVFTRCGALAKMAASGDQTPAQPRVPRTPRQTPAASPPRAGGTIPPFGPGLPLIYFFPFLPIIGIP
ncbi:hypothetical protein GUJ93_ZPchr0006g45533 [Zizania palustris]|uniref:Pollen Ole e 1 allergen and extensin family protein n=1 Tax=Zizania palustris TaxID=103762 RepID=A0A8J5T753_ZIZPA|nr:hypothetical protein GUJ93_ZPchr0006g45533 [Zizania palustris]